MAADRNRWVISRATPEMLKRSGEAHGESFLAWCLDECGIVFWRGARKKEDELSEAIPSSTKRAGDLSRDGLGFAHFCQSPAANGTGASLL